MGVTAAFLLGERARRVSHPTVYGRIWLRLRVHGIEWTIGHHSLDRQNLSHPHSGILIGSSNAENQNTCSCTDKLMGITSTVCAPPNALLK